jgi:hypothetical protein
MIVEDLSGTLGSAMVGGVVIGLALALLRVLTGRVMSASAMIGSLLGGREGPAAPSIAFVAGLFVAPTLFVAMNAGTPEPAEAGWAALAAGGLLVGAGARLGGNGLVGAVWRLTRGAGWACAAVMAGVATSLLLNRLLLAGATS